MPDTLDLPHPDHPIAGPMGRITWEWYSALRRLISRYVTHYFDARFYSVTGNGTTDDTAAVIAFIETVQEVGGTAFFAQSRIKTSAPIPITSRITILGVGYQGDSGRGHSDAGLGIVGTHYSPIPSDIRCTVFLPGNHDCFQIETNEAVTLDSFQISYDQSAASGNANAAIRISGSGVTPFANTDSIISRVLFTNADICISLNDCLEYLVSKCVLRYAWNQSIEQRCANWIHIGDSTIEGCQFWGGAATAHIAIFSGNVPKIIGNKIAEGRSAGDGGSYGILIQPDLAVEQHVEPGGPITGNSIEGQTFGIYVYPENPDALVSQMVITGNQIWVGNQAITIADPNTAAQTDGVTISGNSLFSNGGAAVPIVSLSGCANVGVTGNVFGVVSGTGVAVAIGSNATNVRQSGNTCQPSVASNAVTTPAVPASTVTATNTFPVMVQVHVTGGTGTIVKVNGVTIHTQAAGAFGYSVTLNQGETIDLTYTVAPTWTWRAINP